MKEKCQLFIVYVTADHYKWQKGRTKESKTLVRLTITIAQQIKADFHMDRANCDKKLEYADIDRTSTELSLSIIFCSDDR